MSTVVDQRVVEMQFNNQQFESNVQTSMSTLDKLKEKLNLSGAAKGFDNISSAANKCNVSGLGTAVDTVRAKFSALDVMAVTALSNITNKAADAGERLLRSLTVDNIATGWEKFGQKTQSVGTLISQGYDMDTVEEQLKRLNWFTDETSYNLTDMTDNISKFTATGRDLKESVTAMEGIALWAALSGQNATKASQAMYQLSQAMGSGFMKREDYKSIQNASMDTDEFRQKALDAAIELKTLKKNIDDTYTSIQRGSIFKRRELKDLDIDGLLKEAKIKISQKELKEAGIDPDKDRKKYREYVFQLMKDYGMIEKVSNKGWQIVKEVGRFTKSQFASQESLTDGLWFTSDVMMKVFNDYSAAVDEIYEYATEKGITASEAIEELGDKVDAFGLKAFRAGQEARTWADVVDSVKDAVSTGWMTTFEMIVGNYEEAKTLYTNLANTLYDIFTEGGNERNEILAEWKELGGRNDLLDGLTQAFSTLLDVMDIVKESFHKIFPPMTAERLLSLTKRFKDFTSTLKLSSKNSANLRRTFRVLFAAIDLGLQPLRILKRAVFDLIKFFAPAGSGILEITGSFGDQIVKINNLVKSSGVLEKKYESLKKVLAPYGKILKEHAKRIKDIVINKVNWIDQSGILEEKFSALKKTLSPFVQGLRDFATRIKDVIANCIEWCRQNDVIKIGLEYVSKGLNIFIEYLNIFLEKAKGLPVVGDTIGKLTDSVRDFLNLNVKDRDIFGSIVSSLDNLKKKFTFGSLKKRFSEFVGSIQNGKESVSDALNNIAGVFGFSLEKIKDFAAENMGNILAILSGVGLIAGLRMLRDIVNVLKNLGSPIEVFNTVLSKLGKAFDAFAKKEKADAILRIAAAIALLAASVYLLAQIDDIKKLWSAVGVIVAIAGVLALLSYSIAKIGTKDLIINISAASSAMLKFAIAIGILVGALKVMEDLDSSKLDRDILVLAGLGSMLFIFAMLMSRLPDISGGAVFFIGFAAGIYILAKALQEINNLKGIDIGFVVGIMLTIGIVYGLMAITARRASIGSALLILAIAVAIKLTIKSFDELSKFNLEKIKASLWGLVAVFGTLFLVMLMLSKGGPNALEAGVGAMGLAVAIILIVKAIQMLSDMNSRDIFKGVVAIGAIMIIMTLLIAATSVAGEHAAKAGVMLMAMSVAMLILSISIAILSKIAERDPKSLWRAVGAVSALMAMFAVIIAASHLATTATATIMVIAATIGILAIALAGLAMIEPKKLMASVVALSAVMLSISVMMAASSLIPSNGVAKLLIMAGIVAILGGILFAMSYFKVENALENAEALSFLVVALSAALIPLAAVGAIGLPAVQAGIVALAELIGGLALIFGILGGVIELFPKVEEFIDKGIPLVEKLGKGLGLFVGNIVGGFLEGASKGLPEVGNNLSTFMKNVTPFLDGLKGIKMSTAVSVKYLTDAILALTAAAFLDALAKILGGPIAWFTGKGTFKNFGEGLAELGSALTDYSNNLQDFKTKNIKASVKTIKLLAGIKLPNSGGLLAELIGDNTWSKFADGLADMATALTNYSKNLEGFDNKNIKASVKAISLLADIDLPNSGGKLAELIGDNTWNDFSNGLVGMGSALTNYSKKLEGFKNDNIGASINAIELLANLKLPNSGGFLADIVGDNTWSKFADGLDDFAETLVAYSNTVTGINYESLENSVKAAESVIAMSNIMNGLADIKASKLTEFGTTLKEMMNSGFGYSLKSFGGAIHLYYNSIGSIDVDQFDGTTKTINSLISMTGRLNYIPTNNLESYGAKLVEFGKKIKEYANTVSDIKTKKVVDNIQSIVDSTSQAASKDVTNEVANGVSSTSKQFSKIGDSAAKSVSDAKPKVKKSVNGLMDVFTKGIADYQPKVQNAMTKVAESGVKGAKSKRREFVNAGNNSSGGFVKGILSGIKRVVAAARKMAEEALEAVKSKLNINSPSKEFAKLGIYSGEGFVKGINSYTGRVVDASEFMAQSAIDSAQTAIAFLSEIISSDLDTEPTIRPVVDLSNVRASAGAVSGMFSGNLTFGASAKLNAISNSMQKNQNGTSNDDVVRAINGLRKELSGLGGNTYHIDGITYDDGTNISEAVKTLVRATRVERRT